MRLTAFPMSQGRLGLALKWYVSGPADYMHMDFADGKLAVICGAVVCMWAIWTPMRKRGMQFSVSQVPIPAGSLTPFSKSDSLMQARTIHFLCDIQSILLSFVADDINIPACHL